MPTRLAASDVDSTDAPHWTHLRYFTERFVFELFIYIDYLHREARN